MLSSTPILFHSYRKVSVRLETTQTVETTFANPSRSTKPLVTVVSEHHELTHNSINTSFVFNIPVSTNQEFTTEIGNSELGEYSLFQLRCIGIFSSTLRLELLVLEMLRRELKFKRFNGHFLYELLCPDIHLNTFIRIGTQQ